MSINKETTQLSDDDLLGNQELDQLFCESISSKNIEQVMNCIWDSPNFIFVSEDGNVSFGADNFRKINEEWFSQFEKVRLVIDEIRHIPVGDCVFAVGTATIDMKSADGSSLTFTERWTDVRKKLNGRWVYLLDHAHALPAAD